MYFFDKQAANTAVLFFEQILPHVKGKWSGEHFALAPWQRQIVRDLFGWKITKTKLRRYRRAYIEIPRKNGKSSLCAGLALYMLLIDQEPGAEIFSAASDRDQAAIVFDVAKEMIARSPELDRMCEGKEIEVFRRSIYVPGRAAVYRVVSADAPTKHGLNASCVVFDELHAQPNRELWDVLTTSQGSRSEPLLVSITTAGYDRNSICWEQHEYARRARDGFIADPSFYPVIFAAGEEDDWTSEEAWKKANPNLDISVSLDYIAAECERAKEIPAYQNTFRRLHLNQWTAQVSRWIDMTAWDRCATELPHEGLGGRICYAGLDLASTTDIAALVLAFPPQAEDEPIWALPFFWIPEDGMIERERRDRVPYAAWVREGLVYATPGNVIDYAFIRATIQKIAATYELREIAVDPWNSTQLAIQMQEDGLTVVEVRQGFASLSAPSKELLRLVLAGQVAHGGNTVLRWMADNVSVKQDPAGNVKPDKSKSTNRIDGIVALIMALDRATRHNPSAGRSVYETRGVEEVG